MEVGRKQCADCGAPCSRGSRGRCRPCGYRARTTRVAVDLKCVGCGGKVSRSSRTGRCVVCFNQIANADPDLKRRRAEGIRRKFQDPMHRAKMARVVVENAARANTNPLRRRALVLHGKRQYANCLNTPEVRARNAAAVRAAGWKISEAQIGWCPRPYRELYRQLTRNKRVPAGEARRMVEAQIASDTGGLDPLATAILAAGLAA